MPLTLDSYDHFDELIRGIGVKRAGITFYPKSSIATRWPAIDRAARDKEVIDKKFDPPGGTTGRVGYGTGWMERPCRTEDSRIRTFERVPRLEYMTRLLLT
jgi:hypothetical protein